MPTLTQPRCRPEVVDAVGHGAPQFWVQEVVDAAPAPGSPFGRHSRPPFLKSPTSSFFLVSTEIDRLAVGRKRRFTCRVDVLELGIAVGMLGPFARLAVGLQAVAELAQQAADRR